MALYLLTLSLALAGAVPTAPITPWMCNCNDPHTKATNVSTLCAKAGGQDKFGVFYNVDPIEQHMVCRDPLRRLLGPY